MWWWPGGGFLLMIGGMGWVPGGSGGMFFPPLRHVMRKTTASQTRSSKEHPTSAPRNPPSRCERGGGKKKIRAKARSRAREKNMESHKTESFLPRGAPCIFGGGRDMWSGEIRYFFHPLNGLTQSKETKISREPVTYPARTRTTQPPPSSNALQLPTTGSRPQKKQPIPSRISCFSYFFTFTVNTSGPILVNFTKFGVFT